MTAIRTMRHAYDRNGYYFPLDILSTSEIAAHRQALTAFERRIAGMKLGNKGQLNYPHVICRFAAQIATNRKLLDAVETLIGPDILMWGSTFFFKEAFSSNYVSWHQDMRYWGIEDPDALVSAWLALGPVNRKNGCMRFLPGSHKFGLINHRDSYKGENILTRGQEADITIDEDSVSYVELEEGQGSLHHGYLLHASAPNHSSQRRLGFTMNFIAPHNRQLVSRCDYAVLVRGEDRYNHFVHVPLPEDDLTTEGLAWHAAILAAQNEAMYEGAKVTAT